MSQYTHEIIRKDNAQILLTIKVPTDIVKNTYQHNLQEISKKAHIKGFRKGKAPQNVLEQKFGDALKVEATEKIIKDAMQTVIQEVEHKPLHYSMPKLEIDKHESSQELLIDTSKDFSFSISYDTDPKIETADLKSLEIEKISVKINDNDLDSELKSIQERNAISTDKEGAIADKDVVTYNFVELDEHGNEKKDTKREDFTSTIGASQGLYDLDSALIGMKKDEEKIVSNSYAKDYHYEAIAGKTIQIKIKVTKVKTKDLPPIDDDLAQDVSEKYKTLEDLSAHLRSQLEDRADYLIAEITRNKILHYFIENSQIEIPESAINLQLDSSWKQFVQQYGGDENNIMNGLSQSNTTKETLMEMWKPDAKKQVTEQLLINKLLENEEEITDEEVEATLKEDSEKAGQDYNTIINYYKQHNLMPQIKYDIQQKKIFEKLSKIAIIKERKTMSFTELVEYKKELESDLNDGAKSK